MQNQIHDEYEEVIIKLTKHERQALFRMANRMGANLSDMIRGFITYTTQLPDFQDRLEKILTVVNTFAITRKMKEGKN